jgi:cytoskeleton protein RodZ
VVAEKVPPVPDRLLASRPATSSEPSGSGQGGTVVTPDSDSRSTSELKQTASPQAVPPNVWPGRPDSLAPPTQAQPPEVPLAPPVVVAVPAPPAAPAVMNVPAIGQAQAAQPPSPPEPPRSQQQASPPAEIASRPPAAETPPPAQPQIAPVKVDTPLRLQKNSWVELRAPNGDVLAQTYVRAGESYVIPAGIAYRVIDAR